MEEKIKLQKLISQSGYCSRHEAEKWIADGRVFVNGEQAHIGLRVCENDNIKINGKDLINKQNKHIYILLNKPMNTICTLKDPQNRKTIYEYMHLEEYAYSIGRLDFNTTGVIIITNDGDLANKLAHPSSEVEREYIVQLEKPLSEKDLSYLNSNFVKLNGKYSRQKVSEIGENKYSVILKEGRNHHVKNLFLLVNNYVKKLHRKSYGPITDKNLKVGAYRNLSPHEIKVLKQIAAK
ncbi:pseudouridine synthase [Metamycoplasma neophronis]|uniref:Pseudouridine synthase n=1 Tax=Metamycoplasma neophronis TaxID=872983 RepID=A0ABY2Z0K6_9BACT|nr:pseudouridine synthase [Metamycoplasma neophronis]TPR54096.1 rRNA pseudouridine synthase [Metamycoplasma neophronis]